MWELNWLPKPCYPRIQILFAAEWNSRDCKLAYSKYYTWSCACFFVLSLLRRSAISCCLYTKVFADIQDTPRAAATNRRRNHSRISAVCYCLCPCISLFCCRCLLTLLLSGSMDLLSTQTRTHLFDLGPFILISWDQKPLY